VVACSTIDVESPTRVPLEDAEDVLRTAYCERMFECPCEAGRLFESVDACMTQISAEVDALEQYVEVPGISYDPFCVGEKVDAFDALDCAREIGEDGECIRPCHVFHGEVGEGNRCKPTADGQYSDCNKRYRCQLDGCSPSEPDCTGSCVDPCKADGASPCPNCEEDEFCDSFGNCTPFLDVGDVCTGHEQCTSRFCDEELRCAPAPEAGAPCTDAAMCALDAHCDAATGTCKLDDAAFCTLPSAIE
jgi:hypothetical protein